MLSDGIKINNEWLKESNRLRNSVSRAGESIQEYEERLKRRREACAQRVTDRAEGKNIIEGAP